MATPSTEGITKQLRQANPTAEGILQQLQHLVAQGGNAELMTQLQTLLLPPQAAPASRPQPTSPNQAQTAPSSPNRPNLNSPNPKRPKPPRVRREKMTRAAGCRAAVSATSPSPSPDASPSPSPSPDEAVQDSPALMTSPQPDRKGQAVTVSNVAVGDHVEIFDDTGDSCAYGTVVTTTVGDKGAYRVRWGFHNLCSCVGRMSCAQVLINLGLDLGGSS